MIKIKKLIDPYPGSSFMAPAKRANHESPNEKAKNHFSLRLHSKSNHLNPELFFYGVSQES
jgi:hypothetical protein